MKYVNLNKSSSLYFIKKYKNILIRFKMCYSQGKRIIIIYQRVSNEIYNNFAI